MKATIKLANVSEPMKRVLRSVSRTVLVEAAPSSNTRSAMLAWFIKTAACSSRPGQCFVWISPKPSSPRKLMLDFVEGNKKLRRLLQPSGHRDTPDILGVGQSQIYFVRPDELDDLSVRSAAAVVVEDCHRIKEDPSVWVATTCRGPLRLIGQQGDLDAWWATKFDTAWKARGDDPLAVRVTIDDDIESGGETPEASAHLRARMGDEMFDATYKLKRATAAVWSGGDFDKFCNDRVMITTDKPIETLTARQRQIALDQGDDVPLVPFDLSHLQRRYELIKVNAVKAGKRPRFLLLKYRQGGFTTLEQARNYHTIVTRPRSKVVTLAHTDDSTTAIFQIAKRMFANDPFRPPSNTVGNARKIHLHSDSQFIIATAGGKGVARGLTLQRIHGSEVSQWGSGVNRVAKVQGIMAGLLPGAKNGEVVLETTPHGIEWFALKYKEAKAGKNEWTPIFLPWFEDPLNRSVSTSFNAEEIRETLEEDEKELIAQYNLDYSQIAFRRFQKTEQGILFPQEYPEDDISCFLESGTSYFDQTVVRNRAAYWDKHYKGMGKVFQDGGMTVTVWEDPEPGEEYVMGSDTSEGLRNSDPNGFGIMHKRTGRQVCDCDGRARPAELTAMIDKYQKKYNNCMFGIERQNHGHAVLTIGEREYRWRGHEDGGRCYSFSGGKLGWSTDAVSRPIMLNDLSDILNSMVGGWRDRLFLDECSTFKLQDDGQFRADDGAYDDRVIKWAICNQMRLMKIISPKVTMVDLDDHTHDIDHQEGDEDIMAGAEDVDFGDD